MHIFWYSGDHEVCITRFLTHNAIVLWQFSDSDAECVCVYAVWLYGAHGIWSDGSECEACRNTHTNTDIHTQPLSTIWKSLLNIEKHTSKPRPWEKTYYYFRILFHHSFLNDPGIQSFLPFLSWSFSLDRQVRFSIMKPPLSCLTILAE